MPPPVEGVDERGAADEPDAEAEETHCRDETHGHGDEVRRERALDGGQEQHKDTLAQAGDGTEDDHTVVLVHDGAADLADAVEHEAHSGHNLGPVDVAETSGDGRPDGGNHVTGRHDPRRPGSLLAPLARDGGEGGDQAGLREHEEEHHNNHDHEREVVEGLRLGGLTGSPVETVRLDAAPVDEIGIGVELDVVVVLLLFLFGIHLDDLENGGVKNHLHFLKVFFGWWWKTKL